MPALGLLQKGLTQRPEAGVCSGRSGRITEHEKVLQGLCRVSGLSSDPSILNINEL